MTAVIEGSTLPHARRGLTALLALTLAGAAACSSVREPFRDEAREARTAVTVPTVVAATPPAGREAVAATAAVDAGRSYDADGQLDVYHPGTEGEWPVVVVFADAERSRTDYAGLAASLAVAGSVVVVADYQRDVAPIDADCVMRAAFGWAPGYGGTSSQMALVGFGFGAVLATGETFDGPWTSWSTAHECAVDAQRLDPQVLVTVAGAFGAYTGDDELDPQFQGLSPFSQLGGNPYSRIRLLVGDGDEETVRQDTERFRAALEEQGYDARAEVLDIGDGGALGTAVYPPGADGTAAGAELAGFVLSALDGTTTG